MTDSQLPGSVKGKLGGPSQRRLSSSLSTVVLQAVYSLSIIIISLQLFFCLEAYYTTTFFQDCLD